MPQAATPAQREPNVETADLLFRALRLDGFFPELLPEHVQKLFPRSGLFDYPAGASLCREGDEAGELFVICGGDVEITRADSGQPVAKLGQGEIVGEIAYLHQGRRTATATASRACAIFRLAYADIEYTFRNNPQLAEHLQNLAAIRRAK